MAEKSTSFAHRLREGLERQGMTQTELARRSGISKSSISRYLKGDWEGKQEAVYALAQSLDVNEGWLMGYDVPPERRKETDNVYLTVATVVKKYRRKAGLSLAQAAARLAVPESTLRAWEEGKTAVPPDRLAEMVRLYPVPEEELNLAAANELLAGEHSVEGTLVRFAGCLTPGQIHELQQFARFLQQRDGNGPTP